MKDKIKLVVVFILCIAILLSCSDERLDKDISVCSTHKYIDVSEVWIIKSYNDFVCGTHSIEKNADGSYTVTFIFDKPYKGE